MTEKEILREALECYINQLALKQHGFFDYPYGDRDNTIGNKMHIAERMLKDSYMPERMLQVA